MRKISRFVISLLILLVGAGLLMVYRAWYRSARGTDNRIPPAEIQREVTLRFLECVGKRAVFVLENETGYPIYARVHPADYWKEFKDANLQFGLHHIEYKPSPDAASKGVGPLFDAVQNFRPVMPNETVRYGVDLHAGPGEYTVKVPYMKDAQVARILNEEGPAILKTELDRVKASWRYVSSGVVTTTCQ